MRKLLLIVICILVGSQFFSLDYADLYGKYFDADSRSSIAIDKDLVKFTWDDNGQLTNEENPLVVSFDSGYRMLNTHDKKFIIYHINLKNNISFVSLMQSHITQAEWGSRFILQYFTNKNSQITSAPVLFPVTPIETSSYVSEVWNKQNINYSPFFGLNEFSLNNYPWVVDGKRDKNGWIDFSIQSNKIYSNFSYLSVNQLVICNGYQFPARLDLFKKNARIKNVRIEYGDQSFEAELQDTPDFQVIDLPNTILITDKQKVRLIIESVYPGEKYSDIALSAIYFCSARVKDD